MTLSYNSLSGKVRNSQKIFWMRHIFESKKIGLNSTIYMFMKLRNFNRYKKIFFLAL